MTGWWQSGRNWIGLVVVGSACWACIATGAVKELVGLASIIVTALFITKAANGRTT